MQFDYSTMWDFHQEKNRQYFAGSATRLRSIFRTIQKLTPQNAKVLDIGFGDGVLLELLHDKGYDCFGIDFAKKNIELTKQFFEKRKKDINIQYANIQEMPFRDDLFDIVVASETLEHLNNSILIKGIRETYRILKNGGYFIITVPFKEDLRLDMTSCPRCGHAFHRWGHEQSFDKNSLTRYLEQEKFQIRSIQGMNFTDAKSNLFGKIETRLRDVLKRYKNYMVVAKK